MSSFVYNQLKYLAGTTLDWGNGSTVIRALIERSTSTYTPNMDHPYLDSFTGGGGVELSVASYSRITLGSKTVTLNTTSDAAELDCADLAFGNLESGQTAKAIILYRQIGGSDATPANDDLLMYYDGTITVTLAANAAGGATTIYVDPLPAAIASGTALNFGGGATCTVASNAAAGARSISVSALGASASAGATSANVAISGNILPFALGGGAFNVTINTAGVFNIK